MSSRLRRLVRQLVTARLRASHMQQELMQCLAYLSLHWLSVQLMRIRHSALVQAQQRDALHLGLFELHLREDLGP